MIIEWIYDGQIRDQHEEVKQTEKFFIFNDLINLFIYF